MRIMKITYITIMFLIIWMNLINMILSEKAKHNI